MSTPRITDVCFSLAELCGALLDGGGGRGHATGCVAVVLVEVRARVQECKSAEFDKGCYAF